jgi:hypothetical protein
MVLVFFFLLTTTLFFKCQLLIHFRALEGHTNGDLPWAWCDEGLDDKMATIVGNSFDINKLEMLS